MPDCDAGWCTRREEWEYTLRGIIPELHYSLSKEDILEDMVFIQIQEKNENSRWLYNYLIENEIDDDADITYWFDC
jgi:hypothetical protein